MAERFAELHSAIITRGAGIDDSPEHNAIQGRFLDRAFRDGFVQAAYDQDMAIARAKREIVAQAREDIQKTWRPDIVEEGQWCLDNISKNDLGLTSRAEYEVKGVDVVVSYEWDFGQAYWSCGIWKTEIKPTLVLTISPRSCARCNGWRRGAWWSGPIPGEVCRNLRCGRCSCMSGITVVFVQEIEEAMRQANTPESGGDPHSWDRPRREWRGRSYPSDAQGGRHCPKRHRVPGRFVVSTGFAGRETGLSSKPSTPLPSKAYGSAFALGQAYGAVRGALAASGHPAVVYVQPAVWRGAYGLGGGAAGKAAGVAMARDVLREPERPMTHDEADAVLLAWWGWRNVLNKCKEAP